MSGLEIARAAQISMSCLNIGHIKISSVLAVSAVGPLLVLISKKPDHWFYALHRITYANPVPPENEGNFKLMAEAWKAWGRERGYIGDMD